MPEKAPRNGTGSVLLFRLVLSISGIPPDVHEYRLGNRSALEWVIDQYQVSTDKRSGTREYQAAPTAKYGRLLVHHLYFVPAVTRAELQNIFSFGFEYDCRWRKVALAAGIPCFGFDSDLRNWFCVSLVTMCVAAAVLEAPAFAQTADDDWNRCQASDGDQAIKACTAVIESGAGDELRIATAFQNRGTAYESTGNHDNAILDFDEAIRLQPRSSMALVSRGLAYQAKGEYSRAIQDYTEATRIRPDDEIAFYDRGVANLAQGEQDRTRQYLDRVNDARSGEEDAVSEPGIAYRTIREYAPPMRHAYKTTSLDPGHQGTVPDRASENASDDAYERAIEDFDLAIRIKPDVAQALENRGSRMKRKESMTTLSRTSMRLSGSLTARPH